MQYKEKKKETPSGHGSHQWLIPLLLTVTLTLVETVKQIIWHSTREQMESNKHNFRARTFSGIFPKEYEKHRERELAVPVCSH